MKAQIVVGLGFGDEGKGLTTDFLCSQSKDNLVVRFSGGQQCGHNVRLGEKSHVHSNFGSGTLRGVPSFFSEHCTFYPNTMFEELEVLRKKGVSPVIFLHPLTKMTTPFDVLANRIQERKLKHGSCGLGVGATMKRHSIGYKIFAIDTKHPKVFRQKMLEIGKYYQNLFDYETADLAWLDAELDRFYEVLPFLPFKIADYSFLQSFANIIFEGSQGILLDQSHGIFPNVTFADTTSKNALEICAKLNIKQLEIFYVTRCYLTRHGNGWMPNEKAINLINTEAEINVFNEYQGELRTGEIDYDLLNYAQEIDAINTPRDCLKNLVVTCLDQREDFKFDYAKIKLPMQSFYESRSPSSEKLKVVKPV